LLGNKLHNCTPLWFYLLAEAEVIGRETKFGTFDAGEGLGPVGAQIVAEVIIGLMELDPRSFLSTARDWTPKKDGLGDNVRNVGDILTF